MSSSNDPAAAIIEVLRAHPRLAMTVTELAARSRPVASAAVGEAVAELRGRRVVVTHEVRPPDPHFPAITAVALVGDGSDDPEAAADAERRARECAAVVHRQLLRSHRCQ